MFANVAVWTLKDDNMLLHHYEIAKNNQERAINTGLDSDIKKKL